MISQKLQPRKKVTLFDRSVSWTSRIVHLIPFLVALKRGFVCSSFRPSVCPSVCPSVHEHESKSGKTSDLEAFCVCVCVGRGVGWGVGCGWGLAAPAHPSATILWPHVTCYIPYHGWSSHMQEFVKFSCRLLVEQKDVPLLRKKYEERQVRKKNVILTRMMSYFL